jgi:hypothetical protein
MKFLEVNAPALSGSSCELKDFFRFSTSAQTFYFESIDYDHCLTKLMIQLEKQ